MLLFFYPFREKKELSEWTPLNQNKLLEPGFQTVLNSNKIKFEPYGDLADEAYSRCNVNILDNQDPFGQTENDETGQAVYSNDQDDEKSESNRNSSIPYFILRV